jgi:hypothetical protein
VKSVSSDQKYTPASDTDTEQLQQDAALSTNDDKESAWHK